MTSHGTPKLVALDGPSGCGKSTVARQVAERLGGLCFSTGTVYRGVTMLALDAGVPLGDARRIVEFLRSLRLEVARQGPELVLLFDGERKQRALHSTRVTREIHHIADCGDARAALLPVQRGFARHPEAAGVPLIFEGRDVGTVVFPNAPYKFFLDAEAHERALRRQAQLEREFGEVRDFAEVLADVERRDRFDRERPVAPLRAAPDACRIDTTRMDIPQVVEAILHRLPADWSRG